MARAPFIGTLGAIALCTASLAATPVASYFFQDTFASSTPGAPSLLAINPLGLNNFASEVVFGSTRRIYHMDGTAFPVTSQAGLSLDAAGLIDTNDYTAEIVLTFFERNSAWRMILDAHDRKSDIGFYASPSNHLNVYPVVEGTGATILANVYHHYTLTVQARSGTTALVRGYLDGVKQLEAATDNMNLINADNPNKIIHLVADNVQAGGQGEFSDASIALFRLYRGALDAPTVASLAANPFNATPCIGDLNNDNQVDDSDFSIFSLAYNVLDCSDPAMPPGCPADLNKDGSVDDTDFSLFVVAYDALLCP